MMSYDYILYMLPVMALALLAQWLMKSRFAKYSKVQAASGLTGAAAARMILDQNGAGNVPVESIGGDLTDHYDPRGNLIRLSTPVYGSNSIAAIGVAAHEAGHALQYKNGYALIKLRAAILPISQFGAQFSTILMLIGLLLSSIQLYWAGVALFGTVVLFQLATLPVEFNASRRAIKILASNQTLTQTELVGARKVLTAAAMTYVVATLTAFIQLFYFISRVNNRRR